MTGLEVADLVVIAARTLDLPAAEVLDLLDPEAAEQALAAARPGQASAPGAAADPDEAARPAGALLHALLRRRPLCRGNEPVALAAMLQFLALNGWALDADPVALASLVKNTTSGLQSAGSVGIWLSTRLYRRGAPRPPRLAERLRRVTTRTPPTGMFQRFTERSRHVCFLAQEEAQLLGRGSTDTEHLLLALLYDRDGTAARALDTLGITREAVLTELAPAERASPGQRPSPGQAPFTVRARKALELSLREALAQGCHHIDTQHLLLGLLAEGDGAAARILAALGADRDRILAAPPRRAAPPDPGRKLATDLADTGERLDDVRQRKRSAFAAGDLDEAAALRDQERDLVAEKDRLQHLVLATPETRALLAESAALRAENAALRAENAALRAELTRLRPDPGAARTA